MARNITNRKDYKGVEFDKGKDNLAKEVLVQARINMLLHHPFWGKIATRMRILNADAWCPTAATDGRDFYYNTDFVLSLGGPEKLVFLFAHEVLHCVYDHIARIGDRDRKLCNIAQDYVINADLIHNKIGSRIDEVDIIYDPKYHNWTSEEVYDDLKKNLPEQDIDKLFDQLLDEHLDGSEDGDGDGGDGNNESDRKDGISKSRPKLSKKQREEFKEEMREAMIQAAQGANAGDLPGGVERLIQKITAPQMDWRTLIDMKIPAIIKSDYTYQRFNKKYMQQGIVVPGMDQTTAIDVAVAVDTSGSISQAQLEEMLSEVIGIMDMFDEFTIRIWQFDTDVYGYAEFTQNNAAEIMQYQVKGGGGTNFEVNWSMMKDEGIEPKLFIVFTDGEPWNSWGDPNYCDTLWIINNDYNKGIVPPFGAYAYYEK